MNKKNGIKTTSSKEKTETLFSDIFHAHQRWTIALNNIPFNSPLHKECLEVYRDTSGLAFEKTKNILFIDIFVRIWIDTLVRQGEESNQSISYREVYHYVTEILEKNPSISLEDAPAIKLIADTQHDPRLRRIFTEDDKVKDYRLKEKGDKIRVAFFTWKPFQTDHIMPLYLKMKESSDYEPFFYLTNFPREENPIGFLKKYFGDDFPNHEIINAGDIYSAEPLYYYNPDVVFYQVPYLQVQRTPYYLYSDFVARHARIMHINYGYNLNLETRSTHTYHNINTERAYAIFCESKMAKQEYERLNASPKLVVSGYTKQEEFLKAKYTPSDKIRILWTPHWHVEESFKSSNFLPYKDFILELSQNPNVELHFRPHPLLRGSLNREKLYSFEEFDAYGQKIEENGGYFYRTSQGASYYETFANTDVLISDFSTLACEFLFTQKPIIFCPTYDIWNSNEWLGDPGKELIKECTYIAENEQELQSFIQQLAFSKTHPKKQQLIDYTEKHQMFPKHDVCEYITNWIKEDIGTTEEK